MRVLNNLQILQINTERGNGMCKFCTYHFLLAIPFQWFFAAKNAKNAKKRKTSDHERLTIFPEKPLLLV